MIHRDDLICEIAESLVSMSNENLAELYNSLDRDIQVIYDQDDLFCQRSQSELTEEEKITAADIAAKWEETKREVARMYEGKR